MACAACQSVTCGHSDPVYAGIHPLPAAAASVLPCSGGSTFTGGGALPAAAGDIVDQRAGFRDADGARCGGKAITVHAGSYGRCDTATSSGKADDISAEGNQ
jgi:hypothetical protein